MSIIIRLKRKGARGRLTYKIVVAEKRSKRDGRSIEEIGYYNPLVNPPEAKFDREKLAKWVKKGAQISPKVKEIIKK